MQMAGADLRHAGINPLQGRLNNLSGDSSRNLCASACAFICIGGVICRRARTTCVQPKRCHGQITPRCSLPKQDCFRINQARLAHTGSRFPLDWACVPLGFLIAAEPCGDAGLLCQQAWRSELLKSEALIRARLGAYAPRRWTKYAPVQLKCQCTGAYIFQCGSLAGAQYIRILFRYTVVA